jgi:hypothetical protein
LEAFGRDSGKAVSEIAISSNVTLGQDRPPDTGVAVWFTWDGQQRCIAVDRYPKPEDNLQAIHHVLEARRTEMRHGGLHVVRQTFKGFTALPAPPGRKSWREVLSTELRKSAAMSRAFRRATIQWQRRQQPAARKALLLLHRAAMEGPIKFLPEFEPRPVLTDNNLSAIDADYQDYIVRRYREADVPLLDANSGFEPETFDEEVFDRWEPINKGPWRFGLDETGETEEVDRVIKMLKRRGVAAKRIRPYVMIGHEPYEECMARIQKVWDLGGEPYVQYIIKLNARKKEPWIQHDWTAERLIKVQKWVNSHAWRTVPLADFNPRMRKRDDDRTIDWLFGEAA